MTSRVTVVGVIAKPHQAVVSFLQRTVRFFEQRGVAVRLDQTAAGLIGGKGFPREEMADGTDLIVVLGGDGTLLSVAGAAVEHGVPLAGFNLGTLGFLTELKKDSLESQLEEILNGKSGVSERSLLCFAVQGREYLALNDGVISKGGIARVIRLDLDIDGQRVAEIRGDGLIVSSPTGSTAYSLSAGGPIVHPQVDCMVLTPICPHALTFRPLVIPGTARVVVTPPESAGPECRLTLDGQTALPLHPGEAVVVTQSRQRLTLLTSPAIGYYRLLFEKLNWGG